MSVEENKAIARRLIEEGWANPDILDEIIAEDVAAYPGTLRGVEAYKQNISKILIGFPDGHYVAEEVIAEGDKAVVCFKGSGTHTGEWFGIPPTNKEVKWGGMICLRIAEGKVVEQRGHWNSFWFHTQLGLIPPWEEFVKQAQSKIAGG